MSIRGSMFQVLALPASPLDLQLIDGRWPADIAGHAFVIGPEPTRGAPFFFAPGVVHRLDLAPRPGGALRWQSGRIRCAALRIMSELPRELLENPAIMGMFGPLPNAANTALVPLDGGRLLATFDAGRPVEIDPRGLGHLTSVGRACQWRAAVPGTVQPGIMTSAHPFWDPFEARLYTINSSPRPRGGTSLTRSELDLWLARWDGGGAVERWRVDGAQLSQYVHEVAVTRNFVVWLDAGAYPVEPGQRLGLLRQRAQLPFTDLCIARKQDLRPGAAAVAATVVRIPLEGGHLWADYDDDGERVTCYLFHANTVDLPLRVEPDDTNFFTHQPVSPQAVGMFSTADAIPLGKYRIHVGRGALERSEQVLDPEHLWGLGLGARDLQPDALRTHRAIYASYFGHDPATLTERMIRFYGDHPHRIVPVERLPDRMLPSVLAHIDAATMTVVDRYTLPLDRVAHSPLYIPGPGPGAGWLLAHVWGERSTEVWLFDAGRLGAGPVARLGHPRFHLPFTIHTTWLTALTERASTYRVAFAEDIDEDHRLLPPPIVRAVEQLVAAGAAA